MELAWETIQLPNWEKQKKVGLGCTLCFWNDSQQKKLHSLRWAECNNQTSRKKERKIASQAEEPLGSICGAKLAGHKVYRHRCEKQD